METRIACDRDIADFLGTMLPENQSDKFNNGEVVFFDSPTEIEKMTSLSQPFLWLKKAVAVKNNDDDVFWRDVWAVAEITEQMCAGHFRDKLLVPFIEMCKTMVQTGLIAVNMHAKKDWVAIAIGNASSDLFLEKPMPAPTSLLIHSRIIERKRARFMFDGTIYFNNARVGEIKGVKSLIVPRKWLV